MPIPRMTFPLLTALLTLMIFLSDSALAVDGGVEALHTRLAAEAVNRILSRPDATTRADAFLKERPDIAQNIPAWTGAKDPLEILAWWVSITHERGDHFAAALSILGGPTPESFLALRPDIRDSVIASARIQDPRRILETWLQWNTTEKSGSVDLARRRLPSAVAATPPTPTPPAGPATSPEPTAVTPPPTSENAAAPDPPPSNASEADWRERIETLPRPERDNGWGIHWFPTLGSSREVIQRYLDECEAMGLRWIVFLNEAEKTSEANDLLVAEILRRGMMPVMRLYSRTVPLDQARLEAVTRHYVAAGVRYFQIYNEPNLKCEWEDGQIDLPKFVTLWATAAKTILRAGGFPAFPALCSKGDDGRDDLSFFRECLDRLEANGELGLLHRSWISIHNQTWQPVDYEDDAFCFKKFRFYDRILREKLGASRPVIATEGGFQTGGNPAMNERHREYNLAYYDYMLTAEPWFLAQCHWILGNDVGGGDAGMWEDATWFKPSGELPIVRALKERKKTERRR